MLNRRALIVITALSALLAGYVVVVHLLGLSDALVAHFNAFRSFYSASIENNYLLVLACFFLVYVLVISASLPLAGTMDVLGGVFFGAIGFPIALLSVCLGSIAPFLIARKISTAALSRFDWAMVQRVRAGFAKNDLQYVILMRVVPWAPFSVTTIISGALGMRLRRFLLGTAIGFFPAGLALNAIGQGLGRLADLNDLSMGLLYRDPAFILGAAGIGLIVLLTLARRAPIVSRLFG
jgi:uncharacterized membrane protein YdjX (TVP38/TMEM64 family)